MIFDRHAKLKYGNKYFETQHHALIGLTQTSGLAGDFDFDVSGRLLFAIVINRGQLTDTH